MLSILYKSRKEIPHTDTRLSDDLMLDEAFGRIMQDIKKRQVFISVLTDPLSDPNEIAWRADILHDFTAADNLTDSLRTEFDKLKRLRDEAQSERSKAYTTAKSGSIDTALISARMILIIQAQTAVKALQILSKLELALGIGRIRSDGLLALRNRIRELLSGGDELTSMLEKLEAYGWSDENYMASVSITLGDGGRITDCELVSLEESQAEVKTPRIASLFRKSGDKSSSIKKEPGVTVSDPFGKNRNLVFSTAIGEINELIDKINHAIFDELCPISRELAFYETATAYVRLMKQNGIPLCFPTCSDSYDIVGLRDLLLLTSIPNAGSVVPNDFRLDKRLGVLITGENNSGKTVYLRSVGTAQLMFQAGLPIPAESAVMKIRSAVKTAYAAAEKEFTAGNDAGRFEQEVRALSELFGSMPENSLLLANEIFQTTSYSEGAEGLFYILRSLGARGVSFIIVTHLRELIPRFNDDALHLATSEGYMLTEA